MYIYNINKSIYLPEGIDILVDLDIDLGAPVVDYERLEWIESLMINQVYSGLRKAISRYKSSELPNKFLGGQKIVITNALPNITNGCYNPYDGTIYVGADEMSGIISSSPEDLLLGHEMGHKISFYINAEEAYRDIASVLDISYLGNYRLLEELFAEECGNIVAGSISQPDFIPVSIEKEKHLYMQRLILKNIYHI